MRGWSHMATSNYTPPGSNAQQPGGEQEWVAAQVRAALALQRRHIMPLPVPYGGKNPNRPGWQNERHNGDNAAFRANRVDVRMLLGHIVDPARPVPTDVVAAN